MLFVSCGNGAGQEQQKDNKKESPLNEKKESPLNKKERPLKLMEPKHFKSLEGHVWIGKDGGSTTMAILFGGCSCRREGVIERDTDRLIRLIERYI